MPGRVLGGESLLAGIAGVAVAVSVVLGAHDASASTVDDSTVRVFSIGTVGVETIDLRGHRVPVASPVAGHGSGFLVGDGLVMTAQHVVEGARHVVVRLPGQGGFFPVRVVFADKDHDTAVLAFDATGNSTAVLTLSSTAPQIRSTIFAVGYPIDPTRRHPQSARGIVAGFLDNGTVQLDMALNPGNSGGPVVDEHDVVVGMAIARGNVEQGVQGIGYAVPVDQLVAALDAGKRRLGEESNAPALTSRDSAMFVDELVQHGALHDALHELRKSVEQNAGAFSAEIERTLASLVARTADPDLLVYVAAALWNASIIVDLGAPSARPPGLTPERARELTERLHASSVDACKRAVQIDRTVTTRSAFVQLVIVSSPGAAMPPGATPPGAAPPSVQGAPGPRIVDPAVEVVLSLAPVIRYNTVESSVGSGLGAGLGFALGRPDQALLFTAGVAVETVSFSATAGDLMHTLVAAEVGFTARSSTFDFTAVLAPTWYSSSATDASGETSATAWAMSFRAALGYRLGAFRLGTAARFLSGPTVWFEPLYGSVIF